MIQKMNVVCYVNDFLGRKVIQEKGVRMKKSPYEVGKNYLIRTVTHYYTGRLIAVFRKELVLEDVAWIADTGRFGDAIKNGHLNEVEPMQGRVVVGRGAVIDASIWMHPLPRDQK